MRIGIGNEDWNGKRRLEWGVRIGMRIEMGNEDWNED